MQLAYQTEILNSLLEPHRRLEENKKVSVIITIFSSKWAAYFLKKTFIFYCLANPSKTILASFDVAYSLVLVLKQNKMFKGSSNLKYYGKRTTKISWHMYVLCILFQNWLHLQKYIFCSLLSPYSSSLFIPSVLWSVLQVTEQSAGRKYTQNLFFTLRLPWKGKRTGIFYSLFCELLISYRS